MMTLTDIRKTFAAGFQLGAVNLQVDAGETLGVLGKNGAGKSTLFNLMTANLDPDAGEITFRQQRLTPATYTLKKALGFLPQAPVFPPWVCGEELLCYAARLYRLTSTQVVPQALQRWDCVHYKNLPLTLCSHGMQKRIGLAIATLHQPPLLVLDEPFSGLDVFHLKTLHELLANRKRQQLSNVLSTHILPLAAQLCDRAVVLKNGNLHPLPDWAQLNHEQRSAALARLLFA